MGPETQGKALGSRNFAPSVLYDHDKSNIFLTLLFNLDWYYPLRSCYKRCNKSRVSLLCNGEKMRGMTTTWFGARRYVTYIVSMVMLLLLFYFFLFGIFCNPYIIKLKIVNNLDIPLKNIKVTHDKLDGEEPIQFEVNRKGEITTELESVRIISVISNIEVDFESVSMKWSSGYLQTKGRRLAIVLTVNEGNEIEVSYSKWFLCDS